MHKLLPKLWQNMKKTTLLVLSCVLLCAACVHKDKNKAENEPKKTELSRNVSMRKIVRREIPVTMDFFQITNLSAATVIFTNGPFRVYEEGDSVQLNNVGYDFDGGVLTITTPMEANNDVSSFAGNDDLTVHVSCPDLRTVALCATGGFIAHDTISTEFFQLGGLVMGKIDVDQVIAKKFRYECNGSTNLNIGNLKCDECVVISTGDGMVNMSVDASESAYFDVKNQSSMNLNVSSKLVEGLIETEKIVNMTVEAGDLQLNVLAGTVNLAGTAARQNVRKGQMAVVNNALE